MKNKNNLSIEDIITELKRINKDLNSAHYSLDTVRDLQILSQALILHAKNTWECCF